MLGMLALLLTACTWITEPEYKDRLDVDRDGALWPADCDDRDAAVFPGAPEVCDYLDNDCDGLVDNDALDMPTWYADKDRDQRGDPDTPFTICGLPDGWVADHTDCDDNDATVHPGAEEVCDGVDNDCDGVTDGPDAIDGITWYADADQDGYGVEQDSVYQCAAPSGYTELAGDCDDGAADVHPGAPEICNDFVDNDCSGGAPECRLTGEGPIADLAVRIVGDGGAFGHAVLGEIDLNHDGQDDLVVGAPEYGLFRDGAIYIFYGPISPTSGDLHTSDADVFIPGDQIPSALGASLANPGDLDGDGLPELAVGALDISNSSIAFGGGFYVLRGSDLIDGDFGTPRLTAIASGRYDAGGTQLVVAGDLTADGVVDLVVSAPANDEFAPNSNAGIACMVRGTSTGDLSLRAAAGCLRGAAIEDRLGESMAALGDFDGEGANVLAIGAPRHNPAGAVWVVPQMRTNFDNISDELGIFGPHSGDAFGGQLAGPGDLNGDGYDDLAIGAAGDDAGGDDAGAVYIVQGRLIVNEEMPDAISELNPVVLVGQASGDGAGTISTARDFDQDGWLDLLVAAPDKATEDALDAGRVYLVYGPIDTPGTFALASAPLRLDGGVDYEEIGSALAPAGDLDGDGYPDLAVGAPSDGGDFDGAVYLLYGAGM